MSSYALSHTSTKDLCELAHVTGQDRILRRAGHYCEAYRNQLLGLSAFLSQDLSTIAFGMKGHGFESYFHYLLSL